MKTLGEIVGSGPVLTVNPGATVLEACELMSEQGVGAVLVMDRGKPTGIFTERDLMKRVVTRGLDPRATVVRDVMTRDLVVGQVGDPYFSGLERMYEAACRHLPICDGERLVGMVSLSDLLLSGVEAIKAKLEEARL